MAAVTDLWGITLKSCNVTWSPEHHPALHRLDSKPQVTSMWSNNVVTKSSKYTTYPTLCAFITILRSMCFFWFSFFVVPQCCDTVICSLQRAESVPLLVLLHGLVHINCKCTSSWVCFVVDVKKPLIACNLGEVCGKSGWERNYSEAVTASMSSTSPWDVCETICIYCFVMAALGSECFVSWSVRVCSLVTW